MLTFILKIIAIIQLILGIGYLVLPNQLLAAIGHSEVASDILYPFGMLAARFLVLGVVFWMISKQAANHGLLINAMIGIQILDLLVGIAYTINSNVDLTISAFPMFNAILIIVCLLIWHPNKILNKKLSS
ncbi:hypothetical protein [Marinicellulosiphila megalodicopiae]|uniref:hypothetical protein n=1 Tax=Marinicellulosiphila megalodicopiae TaxID=2724896 RepID=UPI003BAE28CC